MILDDAKLNWAIEEGLSQILSVSAALYSDSRFGKEERGNMASNIEEGVLAIISRIYEDAATNEWLSLINEARAAEARVVQ